MLQHEAEYIDARPLTTDSSNLLATHGRTIHLGHKRTFRSFRPMSALPPKADILHCGKKRRYSLTSSARPSGGSEIVKPSARAVLSCVEPWRENCLQQLKLTFYT